MTARQTDSHVVWSEKQTIVLNEAVIITITITI